MRFDDRLATVLAQPRDDAAACAVVWWQIVDLLAQRPADAAPPPEVLGVMSRVYDRVPQAMRASAAATLAGRRVHPAVVALIAQERPVVSAALIGRVRLEDAVWLALLPRLPVTARALLRQRRDLSPAVRIGLACFGPSDFALPPPAASPPPPGSGAFTSRDSPPPPVAIALSGDSPDTPRLPEEAALPPADGAPGDDPDAPGHAADGPEGGDPPATGGPRDMLTATTPGAFRFETGEDGVILWVEGAPRAALIGATIAQAVAGPGQGGDGQAAHAFHQHASFRDAPMRVAGGSAVAGEWRIAGVPVFAARDGRFTGYRGTARRPHADMRADTAVEGLNGTGLPVDSIRLLIHELRTPLNAIVGFGEMIERQILGPAALRYRMRAGVIVEQGRRLLAVVDDLDMAARAGGEPPDTPPDPAAPADLLRALWRAHRPVAADRGVVLEMAIGEGIGPVDADPAGIERMYARLLAAAIGLGRPGERIAARLSRTGGAVVLRLTRPAVLGDSGEATLLDPGFTPEGDWPEAPLLGLGFSLRLVRNLAIAAGGGLAIEADGFVLRLPVAAARRANGATPH